MYPKGYGMYRAHANADVFRAIADPTRRAILDRLKDGPAPVNVLANAFAQSRPAISKHLRVLREAQVISEHREGRQRIYRIEPEALRPLEDFLAAYRALWQSQLLRLKAYLEQT